MFVDMTSRANTSIPLLVWVGQEPLDTSTLVEGDLLVIDAHYADLLDSRIEAGGIGDVVANAKMNWRNVCDCTTQPPAPEVKRIVAAASARGLVRGVDAAAYSPSPYTAWFPGPASRYGFAVAFCDDGGLFYLRRRFGCTLVFSLTTTADLNSRQRREFINIVRGAMGHTPMSRWLVNRTEPIPLPPRTGPTVDPVHRVYTEQRILSLRHQRRALGEAFREWLNANPGGCRHRYDDNDLADVFNDAKNYDIPLTGITEHPEFCRYAFVRCCDCCGDYYCTDDGTYDVRGNFVCDGCIDGYYERPVENPDEWYLREDLYYWERDGCYHTEEEEEEEEPEDEDEDDASCIHDYSTNVLHYCARDDHIKSSQYGEFLMGVELEVEAEHGYRGDAARDTDAHFDGYALLKSDGSLNNGFEIVTAPRGLAEHLRRFSEWQPHDELTAWDAGTCGLHVHIDSRAFGALTLGKFIKFICADENKGLISTVAGRHWSTDGQAKSYCSGKEAGAGEVSTVLRRKAGNPSRYTAVNMCLGEDEWLRLMGDTRRTSAKNSNTVELRIFRASLRKARLLSQIEFAHAAVRFCRWAGNNELTEDAFRSWLSKRTKEYKNLSAFLKVKKVKPRPGATTPAAEPAEV